MIWTFEAKPYRDIAGREIYQPSRNEKGRKPARSFFMHQDRGLLDPVETANSRTNQHTGATLFLRRIGAVFGIVDGLLGCRDRVYDEIVYAPLFLAVDPLIGIEASVGTIASRNVAGDPRRQIIHLEAGDRPCPGSSFQETGPGSFNTAAERRDQAESCDNHTTHLNHPRLRNAGIKMPMRRSALGLFNEFDGKIGRAHV